MYFGLRTSDTLHKKLCCMGPGLCELPRIPIPRTPVNKGKEKGRSYDARPV